MEPSRAGDQPLLFGHRGGRPREQELVLIEDEKDDVLVEAARSGDARAFESLVARHEVRVIRIVRFLGIPSAEREDVAQEVFLKVFRHLSTYSRGRSFSAWLYSIAVRAAYDWRARARRVSVREVTWSDEADAKVSGEAYAVEQPPGDLARRLESALGTLSERERAVFVLKELEGLETDDIARVLRLSSVTVRRHLGLARARLQKSLAGIERKSLR